MKTNLTAHVVALATLTFVPGMTSAAVDPVRAGTTHDALFSISFAGTTGYSVGADGALLQTSDAGASWSMTRQGGQSLALLGVKAANSHAIAVGQMGQIIERGANGAWQPAASGTTERLMQLALAEDGEAVVVGAFGTVLHRATAAAEWQSISPDWFAMTEEGAQPHLYVAHLAPDGAITIAGEFGLILRSTDVGQSWARLHAGEASVFAMDLLPSGIGYAVGQSSMILKTTDGGTTWAPVSAPGKVLWLGVSAAADGDVLVTGMRELARSRDGGQSWQRDTSGVLGESWFSGIARPDRNGPAYAVGQAGTIIRISD